MKTRDTSGNLLYEQQERKLKMDDVDIMCRTIADHYGYPAQSNQLIEECAELIQAVNKYKRAKTPEAHQKALENYMEEIADVEIMIHQMKYLLGIKEKDLQDIKLYKLHRAINRFEKEG